MPSPGGQASGMAGHKNRCGWAWAGRVWHPTGLPKGYHTTAQGQSHTSTHRFRRRLPLGRRVVGLRQTDGMPHEPQRARSVSRWPVEKPGRETPDSESGARRPDIQPTGARGRRSLVYISFYINGYGRP
jgi:hypothetical protein